MQLTVYSEMLNQLQNWILREPIFVYGPNGPLLSLYPLITLFMRVS